MKAEILSGRPLIHLLQQTSPITCLEKPQFDAWNRTRETYPMSVAIRADREGTHAHLVPTGPFELAHAMAAQAVESAR